MSKRFKLPTFFILIFFLVSCLFLSQCKGDNRCGPNNSPLTDMDSDCTDDESDNCPLIYNYFQIDSDENGVGCLCDAGETTSCLPDGDKQALNPDDADLAPSSED